MTTPTARAHATRATDETFDDEVLGAPVPVLVEFVARWCGPCRVMGPLVERLAEEQAGRLKVVTVDTDDSPGIARRYGIRGVPTVLAFRDGERVGSHTGTASKERLLALVAR
jgi:thioredoxin 1